MSKKAPKKSKPSKPVQKKMIKKVTAAFEDPSKYLLSFDPGGSEATWAYSLSTLEIIDGKRYFKILEAGNVPVVEDIARPDFLAHYSFLDVLSSRYDFKSQGCSLLAERYVGRGITGKNSEYIPFGLGAWAQYWKEKQFGYVSFIMASQWKIPLKKLNSSYLNIAPRFENWWEDCFLDQLPLDHRKLKKYGVHIQDACAIGWWGWAFQRKTWQQNIFESIPDKFTAI